RRSSDLGDVVVHEEGLADRAGVGHARGLDDHAVEAHVACGAAGGQIAQRADQIAAHGAADTAVAQLDDLFFAVLDQQVVVDVFFAEFVFDDGNALAVEFRQDAAQQGGLARSQKAREHGDWNQGIGGWSSIHDGLECDAPSPPLYGLRRMPVGLALPAAGRVRRSACDYIIGPGLGQTRDRSGGCRSAAPPIPLVCRVAGGAGGVFGRRETYFFMPSLSIFCMLSFFMPSLPMASFSMPFLPM